MAQAPDLIERSRILAGIVLVGTVALLVLLIATPLLVPHETLPDPVLVFWGIFVLIVALILGISAAYVFLTRVKARETATPSPGVERRAPDEAPQGVSPTTDLSDLAVRLLDGDERRLFRIIVQAKGDILQRELVRLSNFSDAKVSRLLDRLEERGLIVRVRHGMANRVRLTLGEP